MRGSRSSIAMGTRALLATLWFSLIVFHRSDASLVWELRKLVAVNPKDNKVTANSAINGSPLPNPVPKTDPNPVGETEKKMEPKEGSGGAVSPAPTPLDKRGTEKVSENVSNNETHASSPPPVVTKRDGEKSNNDEEKKKNNGKVVSQSDTNESCDGLKTCTDEGKMVACISETGSKYLVVLIQNGGDSTIKVKPLLDSNLEDIEVAEHQTKKVNISLISSESTQLTLNAGKGECVLPMGTKGNTFVRLPSYDKILTPVNGAYLLILTVLLVFGGIWACCKLRKKRHDGVPYQELEMALPESVSATDVETAEAWDQGWDDDWNDDVAVKSPAAHHSGNISANGLTSRSSNRDGWEDNWDD